MNKVLSMSNATLKSIAKATGYSITTVSRALAGYDDVNANTRQTIIDEAQRQGYEPNLNARLLQQQRTQTIGLIIPVGGARLPDPFFSEFVAGVSNQASTASYDLLLSTDQNEREEIDHYRRIVSRNRVDGLVLARIRRQDPRIDYLLGTQTPFVVFGRTDHADGYAYIDVDGIEGQAALTEHLISLGHTRIAYISAPSHLMFADYRMRGFERAMQQHNLPIDPALVLTGDLTEISGYERTRQLLKLASPPTAVMTGNDLMAFGVMSAIQSQGMRVGHDIAVGGFDDVPSSAHIHPGLTTVRQPIYEIGQQLTEMLLKLIAGQTVTDRAILLKPQLIIRASSDPTQAVSHA